MKQIEQLCVQRYFKPADFGEVSSVSLHHFSDASELGYGQCSNIRIVCKESKTHCCLLLGIARVVPKMFVSIPKLELTAATLSVKVASLLKKELDLEEVEKRFWTDSKVVLGCITNDVQWFKTFVANRVQQIQALSGDFQRKCGKMHLLGIGWCAICILLFLRFYNFILKGLCA